MKKKNSLVITGITSLFLIFCVLCMVILSLLSLGTSRSDLSMSKKTMDLTTSYYDACTMASKLCLETENLLWKTYSETKNADDYFKTAEINLNECLLWNADAHQISMEIPFSDTQALLVCLNVFYPQSDTDKCLEIQSWKTILIGSWNPDTKQPIYQGD